MCETPACACTCSGLRALARCFDDALRPFDLTNGQFSLLMSLNVLEPRSIGSAASLLAVDRTTLTAALKPLERRRLLKVTVDRDDRRGRLLILTPAGRALLRKAYPVWKQTHAAMERQVTACPPENLRAALRALA
jgi:DNA-binding MarR family transcriptional regulator